MHHKCPCFFRFQDSQYEKFYCWIYRIAINTSLNYINSKEKRQEKETISEESCQINDNSASSDPKDYYELTELVDKVQPLINKLPDDLKILIELYEINDNTYEEISKKLSMPIGTVRSRLHRARNMLISDFKSMNDEWKLQDIRKNNKCFKKGLSSQSF